MTSTDGVVALREHQVVECELDRRQVAALQATAPHLLRVEVTPRVDRYRLVAGSAVGTAHVEGMQVLVRPKIPLRNLLYLLGAGHDDIRWWEETFPYDSEQELLPAFLAFFARSLQRALGAGLLRTYHWEEERLPTIRGRIDFMEQLRRPGQDLPIACRYEEFTADNRLNRYLRAAIRRALFVPDVPAGLRRVMLAELARFEEVSDTPVRFNDLDDHVHTRLDDHYRTPLALARILLAGGALSDRRGSTGASTFAIDMNQLFEDFVAERLRRHLAPDLNLQREPVTVLDVHRRVRTKPDIVIRNRHGGIVHVADVKYKLSGSGFARNPDYYQLLAYATVTEQPEGTLIYNDAGGGDPLPTSIEVRHSPVSLTTYRLDLRGDVRDVDNQLLALASWLRDRVDVASAGAHDPSSRALRRGFRVVAPAP